MISKNKIYVVLIILLLTIIFLFRYSPYKIEYLGYHNKIWAHRVNSQKKLIWASYFYDGVELDLVFNKQKNILDVRHPPVKSIDLTFNDYLGFIPEKKTMGLWLDIKNLTKENAQSIFQLINSAVVANDYPVKNIIIESRFPEGLKPFIDHHYHAAYYLKNWLYKEKNEVQKKELDSIQKILFSYPEITLSFDYRNYTLIDSVFPKKNKQTWIVGNPPLKDFYLIRKMLSDTTIKVVLATFKSPVGNR